jgi:hypothetical protein
MADLTPAERERLRNPVVRIDSDTLDALQKEIASLRAMCSDRLARAEAAEDALLSAVSRLSAGALSAQGAGDAGEGGPCRGCGSAWTAKAEDIAWTSERHDLGAAECPRCLMPALVTLDPPPARGDAATPDYARVAERDAPRSSGAEVAPRRAASTAAAGTTYPARAGGDCVYRVPNRVCAPTTCSADSAARDVCRDAEPPDDGLCIDGCGRPRHGELVRCLPCAERIGWTPSPSPAAPPEAERTAACPVPNCHAGMLRDPNGRDSVSCPVCDGALTPDAYRDLVGAHARPAPSPSRETRDAATCDRCKHPGHDGSACYVEVAVEVECACPGSYALVPSQVAARSPSVGGDATGGSEGNEGRSGA